MDKQRIIEAVETGMSYAEVAELSGCSRNAVAGISSRAGDKTGKRPMPVSARWKISNAAIRRHHDARSRGSESGR